MNAPQIDINTLPSHLIRRLNQMSAALFTAAMTEEGLPLTPVQYAALWAISENPDVDQASVAKMIGYDRATLGKVIDRLESKSLIQRVISRADRRAREISISAEGRALLDRAHPIVLDMQPRILPGITEEERATLVALMTKVAKAGDTAMHAPKQKRLGD